ncbi:MAG: O-methyltransferase [Tunicatimonas sp.]
MNTALLNAYAAAHSTPETALLRRIRRETHLQVLMPQMLSGPAQGALLAALVRLTRARRVLEIGTFTGYASLWMAQALPDGGLLHTIDRNEELEDRVRGYFGESSVGQRIRYHLGDAREVIPTLDETFDLVFIDADKDNYQHYYELIIDKVRENGLIVVDNVLWGGKVMNEKPDRKTKAIRDFNDYVHHDARVANVLLPLRDGLLLLIKQEPTNL